MFETTQEYASEQGHPQKITHTWQPTNHTLKPQLTQTHLQIQYNPYQNVDGNEEHLNNYTWYPKETMRYTNGLLHNTTQPTQTTWTYTKTDNDETIDYGYEPTITHYYHYHGTPVQTAIHFAHLQGAITDTEKQNLYNTLQELTHTPNETTQQQLYNTLDSL